MKRYVLTHLSDAVLLRDLATLIARDRATTAELLAHIAEVDERKLYLPAAYPSMFAYCVGELRLSEDAAAKRIQAARIARRFPAVYAALAEGRLNLTSLGLLAPYLTEETAQGLFAAAADKTKAEIQRLLAERFPRPDVFSWVACSTGSCEGEHAPAHVHTSHEEMAEPIAAKTPPAPAPRMMALSSQSFGLQVTIGKDTHDKLRHAEELLGHRIPSGDIAAVLDRVLDLAIAQLEKRKFAATAKPRPGHRPAAHGSRHIPAHVQRAVWERDGGQCTYVSEAGHRCEARTPLEFDHALEFARGGEATVDGIRLLCRAHNQHAAERTFGSEFMRHKRIAAAEWRAAAKSRGKEFDRASLLSSPARPPA